MLIIYGTRYYGQIDTHEGQRQITRFAHLYWLPLLPISTMWVTGEAEDGFQGHAARWSMKSAAAGYARVWGPIIALGSGASLTPAGFAVAAVALGLAGWSWTWRALRGPGETRRSDVHLAVYGTRCDPLRMPSALAEALRVDVDAAWARISGGRTPEDVARLGTSEPQQGALAYAALRLSARLAPGEAGQRARAASERVLAMLGEQATVVPSDGPYRSGSVIETHLEPRA